MLLAKNFSTGKLRGTIYTFEHDGDVLPMHTHGPHDVHITIVAKGTVRCHGPSIGDHIHAEGTVLDAEAGVTHEFIGLAPGARIINIVKDPPDACPAQS